MKTRFNTFDILCSVAELQSLVGLRVNQVYDIDNKTYLIRFQDKDVKTVLLLESGFRIHTTAFEWPKNMAPSGFTMKLRKHLKNKRLEKLEQLSLDRIISLQFGIGEAAYHVIVELYDRGNIILTDHQKVILNILRPHTEGEEVRFAVREKYPESRAKEITTPENTEQLETILRNAPPGEHLKRFLNPILAYGSSLIEHVLLKYELLDVKISEPETETEKPAKGKAGKNKDTFKRYFDYSSDLQTLMDAINEANAIIKSAAANKHKGVIIQKRELKPSQDNKEMEYFYHNIEYHPFLFHQHKDMPHKEFDSFDMAVDEFYSTLEGQKIDVKTMQQERDALKKLSNVKRDHEKRLEDLSKVQIEDKKRAELITRNQALVENAILAIRSALANQMAWLDIHDLVKAAQSKGDAVATCIKQLKLETNHISLYLTDPYDFGEGTADDKLEPMTIDIDLSLSAYSNATRYYDQKRSAAKKEQRTIESSSKALKNAERKTQQTLKEVRTISTITKARKVFWFEKFYWFISSENYLVIGGRDQQQNELIVKRYMRPTDIYVHAEIQGASSVVIRNPSGNEVPPKTLLEAGTMAICYSVAWDAKVVTNAYWVKSEQVSKTAQTGEYLGTGSFVIRGKKNFLPQCHLTLGMSFLFKLEESSIPRHLGERRVRTFEDESIEAKLNAVDLESDKADDAEQELEIIDLGDENNQEENREVDNNSDEDKSDQEGQFPDTHIKIDHKTENNPVLPTLEKLISVTKELPDDDQAYIIHAAPQKVKQNKQKKNDKEARKGKKPQVDVVQNDPDNAPKSNQPKRGQKSKLKKIKEKYKDQDEEEKRIRMDILKSAGNKAKKPTIQPEEKEKDESQPGKKVQVKQVQEDVVDELDDAVVAGADVDMLDSLTGCPVEDDEILFAVPVIAPYQALQHFKFKVKLTPGTGRRGKAAKTAMMMFLKEKTCTNREKDLLKGVKDETIARNIPGKVKMQMSKLKK
ncbi:Ribosome quality control complex subunit NEMF like [Pseudolycoriella hygida]|uniref:Ribosome quality control complex subunit NEMF like n=1 Tax=Pseudolycoriella hygida TaxID=35572 RepID=A0A9Q0MY07_9DIPT|nr:Ribosome quality control complex subunit NEMF like [Pseudolycoriella hygida]